MQVASAERRGKSHGSRGIRTGGIMTQVSVRWWWWALEVRKWERQRSQSCDFCPRFCGEGGRANRRAAGGADVALGSLEANPELVLPANRGELVANPLLRSKQAEAEQCFP